MRAEAVHDLADALRGLPEALENLNTRIEQAGSKEELEKRVVELQHQQDVERQQAVADAARIRRRSILWMATFVLVVVGMALAFVIFVPVANNRRALASQQEQLKILRQATSAQAQKTQQDMIDLLAAKLRCSEQADMQVFYSVLTGKTNLVFDPPACQQVVDALQAQLSADAAAVKAAGNAATTTTTERSSPPTARPRVGPGTTAGRPGPTSSPASTTTTTAPPRPTTTTTTTPSPPPRACVTTPVSISACIQRS